MKEKIMYLIIGILIGAIITTSGFLIYNKLIVKKSDMPMNRGNRMERLNGDMGEPPSKPDGENDEEPPEKPDGDSSEKLITKYENSNNT